MAWHPMRIVSVLFLVSPVVVCGAILPSPLIVSSDLTFVTEDVFRGVGVAKKSFQPTVEVSAGDFYAGVWGNLPVASGLTRFAYYGGMSVPVPSVDFFEIDTGLTVYDYPGGDRERTWEFYLGANIRFPKLPQLGGAVYYFHDFDLETDVGEARGMWMQSLERIGVPGSVDYSAYVGVQGAGGGRAESYHYYGVSVSVPFSVSAYSVVRFVAGYGTAENYSFGPGERGKALFGSVGYSTMF